MVADIHTHILHAIDDGSSSVDESLELLKREKSQGVSTVVLTPHFNVDIISLDTFLKLRDERYNELLMAVKNQPELKGMNIYLGAEVAYSPNLVKIDVEKLVVGNTRYLLLELPIMQPFNFKETLEHLNSLGIIPILAHVERYGYLSSKRKLLSYKSQGALIQSNVSALLSKHKRRFVLRMLKKGYIDILASDTHNLDKRMPKWERALNTVDYSLQEKVKNSTLSLFSDIKEEQNV